jgi:hypothetical protein
MTEEIAKQIVDAYKASPMLTGLLLMNVGLFLGMGYYIIKVQQGAGEFVREMQVELIDLAKTCKQ